MDEDTRDLLYDAMKRATIQYGNKTYTLYELGEAVSMSSLLIDDALENPVYKERLNALLQIVMHESEEVRSILQSANAIDINFNDFKEWFMRGGSLE